MTAPEARCPGRLILAVVAGATLLTLALAAPSPAAIITVTGTGDTIAVDGLVTLREALTAANTNAAVGDAPAGDPGLDQIRFNIAGLPGTVHTIQLLSALPTITEPVFIDGYSQLGASPNTLPNGSNAFLAIELDGFLPAGTAGLTINAGGSTVQGLVINRFTNEGIRVLGDGNVVRGNFLGTDPAGKVDRGNGIAGVALFGSNNVVGGTAPADRNLISGNNISGVSLILGTGNRVEGNLIGTDDTGMGAIPNSGGGVRIFNVPGNTIGGTAAGAGNVIAFNSSSGVQVIQNGAVGNAILGNSIRDNEGPGIDLANDGVTPNDPPAALDGDVGPNGLQNFPILTSVVTSGSSTFILGRLDSAASTQYRIEFFASASCDPSGNGEGATFLGSQNVTTSASGSADAFFAGAALAAGQVVTATATDPGNSTSEFSPCVNAMKSRSLGDFDGDGKRDLAIYRNTTGDWFIFGSASGFRTFMFGTPAAGGLGDTPVPADFDGDGITDPALYRKATAEWFIFGSTSGFRTFTFGTPAATGLGDTPVPGDYDGDGVADPAIFRKATAEWIIFGSATGLQMLPFGAPAFSGLDDRPVPGQALE